MHTADDRLSLRFYGGGVPSASPLAKAESLPILTDIASEVVTRALRMETMYGALDLLRFAASSAFSWVRW